jgi:hypothetical protein
MRRIGIVCTAWMIGCGAGDTEIAATDSPTSGTDATTVSTTASTTDPSTTTVSTTSPSSTTDDPDTSGTDSGPPTDTPLLDRLSVVDIVVREGVAPGVGNWRIWGIGSLNVAPVFTVPLASCETLVGYTSSGAGITSRVAHLDATDALVGVIDLAAGLELRGLAAEGDGHFGALVWDPMAQQIWVRRYDMEGTELWSTELTNPDNTPTDFGIGDSRLEFGGGRYGAYYHVHSDSGHEGDTLKWVDTAGVEQTQWGWGCSHSMSNVLRYQPATDHIVSMCVTDCYPGTNGDFATQSIGGIYIDGGATKIIDVAAGCNGSVAGELGSAAVTPDGWNAVFNAHQNPAGLGQQSYDPATMNQDIGFADIGGDLVPGAVVWLTDTPEIDEDDASIARWTPEGDDAEQYVVGWHEPDPAPKWWLARIDAAGAFLEGPVEATGIAAWGRRDDPFRPHTDGDVGWSWFDTPGSTTLHVARVDAGRAPECASF